MDRRKTMQMLDLRWEVTQWRWRWMRREMVLYGLVSHHGVMVEWVALFGGGKMIICTEFGGVSVCGDTV